MEQDYIASAIAEAKAISTPETTTEEVTPPNEAIEPEGQAEENGNDTTKEVEKSEEFPKKAVNALARKDKKLTKAHASLEAANARIRELEARLNTPAPKESDFEGKEYGEFLSAAAKHAAKLELTEQAIEAARNETEALNSEYANQAREALDESGENAEKTYPDFRQVIESKAAQSPNGKLEFSQPAWDAIQRSDNGAAAIYAIIKDGKFEEFNSVPLVEAAMMVKEYEIKAQSFPKIKHVSSAPEPITSARGLGSGSKSIKDFSHAEALDFLKS